MNKAIDRCTSYRIRFDFRGRGSRGITYHKGNAKYITKLHRATKLEISFGCFQLNVAQIDKECLIVRNFSDIRHAISSVIRY